MVGEGGRALSVVRTTVVFIKMIVDVLVGALAAMGMVRLRRRLGGR